MLSRVTLLMLIVGSLPSLLLGLPPGPGVTREEVLALVYPGADFHPERVFLTAAEQAAAGKAAGLEITSPLIARYTVIRNGQVIGRAYVDTHVVRTKKESLLVCVDTVGQVLRVEATAFLEPPEYRASQAWFGQFEGKPLQDDLRLQGAIRPIAGATLTAIAATQAVRRVLAIDRILVSERKEGP